MNINDDSLTTKLNTEELSDITSKVQKELANMNNNYIWRVIL